MNDHWKSVKAMFWIKNYRGWYKKDKKIDWNTGVNKKILHSTKSNISLWENESKGVS